MTNLIQLPEGSICLTTDALTRAARDVRHVSTKTRRNSAGVGPAGGTTVWGQQLDGRTRAWVEWDWVEMSEGVVVQADPLNVRSNVLLLDDLGRPVLSSRRRALLATLTYLLPWQGPVLDKLRSIGCSLPRLNAAQGMRSGGTAVAAGLN